MKSIITKINDQAIELFERGIEISSVHLTQEDYRQLNSEFTIYGMINNNTKIFTLALGNGAIIEVLPVPDDRYTLDASLHKLTEKSWFSTAKIVQDFKIVKHARIFLLDDLQEIFYYLTFESYFN
jgi:hypothetical protein